MFQALANSLRWYKYALSQVVDYQGRAGRTEAVSFFVYEILIVAVLFIVGHFYPWVQLVGMIFVAMTAIPCVLVLIRRLHDIGYSGWWWPIAAVPPVCFFVLFCPSEAEKFNEYGTTERLEDLDREKSSAMESGDGIEYLDDGTRDR